MLKVCGEECGRVSVENLNEENLLADLGVRVKEILMSAYGLDFPTSG
jgi:hypothetical protein